MPICDIMHKLLVSVAILLVLALGAACGPAMPPPTKAAAAATAPPATSRPAVSITSSQDATAQPTATAVLSTTAQSTAQPLPTTAPTTGTTTVPALSLSQRSTAAEARSPNLVLAENGGRVVWVSDELTGLPASNLIDGYKLDEGEWWTHEPPLFPQTVVFALTGNQAWAVDRVVLNTWTSDYRQSWIQDFEVYASASSPNLEEMGWLGSFTLEHVGIDQEFDFDPVWARYMALVVTSHYGSEEGISLNEFEVYEASPGVKVTDPQPALRIGNLVAASNGGSVVDYSSQDSLGNWPVERLIDGQHDTDTGWSSDAVDGLQYVVFGVAGDRPYRVDRVVLNPYSRRYHEDWIQEFELWASDHSADLEQMEQLGAFVLEQIGEDQEFSFSPVALRYIALVPLSNYGGTEYSLNEFEVYAASPGTQTSTVASRKEVSVPQGVALPRWKIERPPESTPQMTRIRTDFGLRRLVASPPSPVEKIEFRVEASDLVPVIYHLYGRYFEDLVKTTITNTNDVPVRLRVETSLPEYTQSQVDTLTLAPGETAEVSQNPPFAAGALDRLHSQKVANLHVLIEALDGSARQLLYEGTQSMTIYSRADFPWNIPGYYNGTIFMATLVMPNDPALDELMRLAADYVSGGIITHGYADEDDASYKVWNRMKAVYEVVAEEYGVIYVAVGTDFVPQDQEEEGFTLQRLKLPYEVLESHSGMCVELSTLFASTFEKMGLRPVILTIPGHVFVAVPISWDSSTYYVLEGTLVGRASFEEAVTVGNQEFEDALAILEADRLDSHFWLDISEARQEGIWPIPWR